LHFLVTVLVFLFKLILKHLVDFIAIDLVLGIKLILSHALVVLNLLLIRIIVLIKLLFLFHSLRRLLIRARPPEDRKGICLRHRVCSYRGKIWSYFLRACGGWVLVSWVGWGMS
jgi:hypothetical protein